MNPIFLYENKYYNVAELNHSFKSIDVNFFIEECLGRGIAKRKQIAISFQYVGVIVFQNQLLLFLPKYLKETLSDMEKKEKMKTILEVLKVYSQSSITMQELEFFGDFEQGELFNYLSAADYFINDYIENGLYHKDKIEYMVNGNGETDWQQTIDSQASYLSKDQSPVYLELIKEETLIDQTHIIIEIHKAILNECSQYLTDTGLNDFLDYPSIQFPSDFSHMENKDFQLMKINDTLYQDYNDRNVTLLNNMYRYIIHDVFSNENKIIFFGTKSFYTVWEKCCASVMDHDENIAKTIAKPVWTNFMVTDSSKDTLIPDILKELSLQENKFLFIIDAKYYNISFTKNKVIHNPGIQDVVKQYMYEKALHPYIDAQEIQNCYNIFLFPHSENALIKGGEVSVSFLSDLKNINLLLLPADEIFHKYITYQKWNIEEWILFVNIIKNSRTVYNI